LRLSLKQRSPTRVQSRGQVRGPVHFLIPTGFGTRRHGLDRFRSVVQPLVPSRIGSVLLRRRYTRLTANTRGSRYREQAQLRVQPGRQAPSPRRAGGRGPKSAERAEKSACSHRDRQRLKEAAPSGHLLYREGGVADRLGGAPGETVIILSRNACDSFRTRHKRVGKPI
jgi:hypothetical protein